ncbi:IS21-like element helper ATPase IstB [Collinsella tanakaei]|uniref:IS21-like element helper ATPase IstB n=1 Tax=Collinsella tanakaei TaxID=626935 RepID=UPI001F303145|nr:IS21-like element helper ATPase IstB [Collinsella tanakaei]MCF2622047.1 IS21-like element helper ATPase IstB [Collinsella tanakaei]
MQTAQIEAMAERLKCTYIRNSIDPFLEEAAAEGWGTVEALSELLSRECETRRLNGIRRRMSRAHFPFQMRFEMFVDTHLSPEVRREARILETMAFLDDGSNVVLVGNPGVGKTALAVALGTKACEEGRTVAFINVPNLVIEMKEAMSLNQLTAYKKGFERYDLVILDDLGYCSFNRECGEVLFNLLSSRNGKGSTIITTNLMFDRWDEVFDDPVLTGVIVDRIAHKVHVVDMTGESYRVIETKEWIERANKMMD